jgi:membrane protein
VPQPPATDQPPAAPAEPESWLLRFGPLRLLWDTANALADRDGFELAGHIAFTAMMALFPFLLFLTSLAGFLGDRTSASTFVEYLFLFMPLDVVKTLNPVIIELLSVQRGDLLTLGLVGALWSAMSGVDALRISLNRAYRVTDDRPYWQRKLQDLVFVLIGTVLILVFTLLIVFGPTVSHVVAVLLGGFGTDIEPWHWARYMVTLLLMAAGLVALHRSLPAVRHRLAEVLPGVVTTTVLWVVAGSTFGTYLSRFSNYGTTYGSLGGVAITLLFFYISAILFLFGGQLNAELLLRREARIPVGDWPQEEVKTGV